MNKKQRTTRNIICIVAIVAMLVLNVGALVSIGYNATNNDAGNAQFSQGEATDGKMPNGDNANFSNDSQPPEIPNGDSSNSGDNSTPPEKPDGDSSNSDNNSTPPEKPDGDDSSQPDMGEAPSGDVPEMPQGENGDGNQMGTENTPAENGNTNLAWYYYVGFVVTDLILVAFAAYLVMSKGNKLAFKQTLKGSKRIVVYVIVTAIITGGLTVGNIFGAKAIAKSLMGGSGDFSQGEMQGGQSSGSSDDATGATEITDEQELNGEYTSSTDDENAILVKDGGNLTLSDASVTKTGDSSNTENSEFYGINAGILVTENSTATIKNATISTDATGANAVFATGENALIYISDSTITTTGSSSARGLDATYGGKIEATNMTITTQGGSCATLATDRGEGTVICSNSTLETNGAGSPIIYSTGDIQVNKIKGTSNAAQAVVVEGKNSATVRNSTITCSGQGNRNDVDNAGIMIYQSMSGDASEGTGTFNCTNSTIAIDKSSSYYKSAPMFFITNTDAQINLESSILTFGSNVLLSVKGTDEWGNSGSNGGNVTLNAKSQDLAGNIELDNISTLEMNLTSSTYEGTINADNSAKSVALTLDEGSTITLTGDSYVTSLDDAESSYSNINFNGYTLYVNGKAVN